MTQEQALELFNYKDGNLYWKKKTGITGPDRTGMIAGTTNGNGYRQVMINQKIILQHRIIFLMHHGYIPVNVDHKDRDRSNNKIDNLRAATSSQNQANRIKSKNNTSGYKGVSYEKLENTYRATTKYKGKKISIGSFKTAEEAALAYNKFVLTLHKEFACV